MKPPEMSAVVAGDADDQKWLTFSSRHIYKISGFSKLLNLLTKVPFFIANMNSMNNFDEEKE